MFENVQDIPNVASCKLRPADIDILFEGVEKSGSPNLQHTTISILLRRPHFGCLSQTDMGALKKSVLLVNRLQLKSSDVSRFSDCQTLEELESRLEYERRRRYLSLEPSPLRIERKVEEEEEKEDAGRLEEIDGLVQQSHDLSDKLDGMDNTILSEDDTTASIRTSSHSSSPTDDSIGAVSFDESYTSDYEEDLHSYLDKLGV